jgi:hypothetical protein
MTRAACELILRVSTFGLVWRSVKDLKRITEAQAAAAAAKNEQTASSSSSINDDPGEYMELHDWEILQLWALYAFHTLYIYSGLEWFVSFVPLYYYMKMILLVITFLIPNTKFANFWFELLLVPMMQRVHEILNLDWKTLLYQEMILLPWQILDLFLLPGLMSDQEAMRVMTLRQCQLEQVTAGPYIYVEKNNENDDTSCTKDRSHDSSCHQVSASLTPVQATTVETATTARAAAAAAAAETTTSPTKILDNVATKDRRGSSQPSATSSSSPLSSSLVSSSFTSPIARSRVAVSSLHLRKFSRDHHNHNSNNASIASRTRSKTQAPPSPERIHDTKHSKTTKNNNLHKRPPPSVAFKQTKASILSSNPTVSNKNTNRKSVQKSTSTIRRRKGGPKPESSIFRPPSLSSHRDDSENDLISPPTATTTTTSSTTSSKRKSMGKSVRKFITGDDNIRIRDFLFDLDLPSIPSPMRRLDDQHGDDDDDDPGDAADVVGAKIRGGDYHLSSKSKIAKKNHTGAREQKVWMEERRRLSLEQWKKERNRRNAVGVK